MKSTKKRFSKIVSLMLCAFMLLQVTAIGGLDMLVKAEDAAKYITAAEAFDTSFDQMKASGLWAVESKEKTDATAPEISEGAMKMDSKDSVKFNWANVAGIGKYDAKKEYTFEFDIKVTNAGNGFTWNSNYHTRILYVGFGGWFNQIEIKDASDSVRVGDDYNLKYTDDAFMGKTVHAKLVLCGDKITSTLTDAEGNVLKSHYRTSSAYTNMTDREGAMTYLVLRCEDGAVEIDNFTFVTEAEPTADNSGGTEIDIPAGKQAVYKCEIDHKAGSENTLAINGKEALALSDEGLELCGAKTLGTYSEGKYGVKIVINKEQKLMYIELTLPDGGVIRRGSYEFANSETSKYNVAFGSSDEDAQSGVGVTYEAITANKYELVNTEPAPLSDFEKSVYNLVTSFDDACTTRNFAWTTKNKYATKVTMLFRYREAGTTEWTNVQVTKLAEKTDVGKEDYYQTSISGLKPDTSYEYQLGKKGQIEAKNVYGMIYTFKTAKEDVNSFEFVAVGDTQSVSWGGDEIADRGYKYAAAAIKQAIEDANGRPAFILNAGDVTDRGDELSHWNWYFKSLGNYGQAIPHFATVGNHDTLSYDKNNFFSLHFNHPDNGVIDKSCLTNLTTNHGKVQVESQEETVYSYNYGGAHFIVLNSGIYGADDEYILKAQREWLTKDLEANKDAKWTVIMVHEAVYHRKGGEESRPWLNDVIESYGVDLVIQGHSHLVTRTYPMKNGKIVTKLSPDVIQKGTGTVYTTIGSTTLNHDGLGDPNVEECMVAITPDNNQPAYTVVKVTDNNLTMTIKQLDGAVLDEFVITTGTADAPEQQLPAEPEPTPKPPEQTTGATTTTSATVTTSTTVAAQTTGTTENNKGGCGSTIASGAIMLTSALGLGIGLSRKKKRK